MKKIIILIFLLCTTLTQRVLAQWGEVEEIYSNLFFSISIGNWDTNEEFIEVINLWNLNIWKDEQKLNRNIPQNQIFTYDSLFYIVKPGATYNPLYNGLPGNGSNAWAIVSIKLNWVPNVTYRNGQVVKIDNRWFIANIKYNSNNWFVNNPLETKDTEWSEWREIYPMKDSDFSWLIKNEIRDYSKPDASAIIYLKNYN